MIPALLLGRKGSKGFPGKNTHKILGHPLAWYPMQAAIKADKVGRVFLSTDDKELINIAKQIDVEIITRPDYLCSDSALGEDAYVHGYEQIKIITESDIQIMVLLFCNAATITYDTINNGIQLLIDNPEIDSAVTVSRYNMWSPLRARKQNDEGFLEPFVPFETFGNPKTLNCDRDSQGDVFFADMGCSIVRTRCLESIDNGLLPQKWMGQKIAPLFQEAGCDVDYEWQVPGVEWWLKKHGGY